MANTTNFNWETPDDTDLVKDGALAIRTLGNSIDTTLVDLKGGTTGQVLSKTSNTDMDFTWVTSDDANAIQNAIVDAKGDLIAASAADTPARLAVGNNGETLVADSSATTGLRWSSQFLAGKNKIINGDLNINQRAFVSSTTSGTYGFDRFYHTGTSGTVTGSAQTFTAGSAPAAPYEARNFFRLDVTGQTGTNAQATFRQVIEDVRTLANQTVTVSFWAKAASGTPKLAIELGQVYDSVSGSTTHYFGQVTLSTSWARYSVTSTLSSLTGKTIGNASGLNLVIFASAGTDFNARTGSLGIQTNTFDFWGVQVEAGSVATPFTTATGTLAGELAACQRYYQKSYNQGDAPATATTNGVIWNWVGTAGTGTLGTSVKLPVIMRTTPTLTIYDGAGNSGKVFRGAANKNAGTQTGSDGTITIFTTDATSTLEWYFHFVASAEL